MRRNNSFSHMLLGAALILGASQALALTELNDESLGEVTGEGIAFALDNFSFRMAPTSFVELTGTDLSSGDPAYAAPHNWRRGDLRYYGFSMTGVGGGMDWAGNGCTPGTDGLGCPLGGTSAIAAPIKDFASVYNPYMVRVFQYAGYSYEGTCLGSTTSVTTGGVAGSRCSNVAVTGANASPTFYEFLAPSKGDPWRWAFWGQLLVNNNNTADFGGLLKSQTIIRGNNFTKDNKPSRLLVVQTPTSDTSEQSLSVIYESRLSGSFRFSVGKNTGSSDLVNTVPDFNDNEGLYFKNVDAFLPIGQPNYQSVVFRNNGTSGDFVIELTPVLPTGGNMNVPNTFYCNASSCPSANFTGGVGVSESVASAGCVNVIPAGYPGPCNRSVGAGAFQYTYETIDPASANPNSHGYVHWGDPSLGAPGAGSDTDGIYFKNNDGTVTNIGRATIDGMLINSLKFTSLGVGG